MFVPQASKSFFILSYLPNSAYCIIVKRGLKLGDIHNSKTIERKSQIQEMTNVIEDPQQTLSSLLTNY
jgi:hypothetical protein